MGRSHRALFVVRGRHTGAAMHLYETHLPVRSTEVSQRFYIDVVGLEFGYRDPTRDAVFLLIGSNRRSMLGLWGPSTTRGSDFHSAILQWPCPCRSCWPLANDSMIWAF